MNAIISQMYQLLINIMGNATGKFVDAAARGWLEKAKQIYASNHKSLFFAHSSLLW